MMNSRTPTSILLTSCLGLAAACGSNDEPPAENAQERQTLLVSVADNVILPAYQRLVSTTTTLERATQTYASAVGTGDEATARTAAEAAFREAYSAMQYAELLQVGPYGPASTFDAGQNLRDEIYSWPGASIPCQVDIRLVERAYESATFFSDSSVDVYGFDALEYLLSYREADNSCAAPVRINSDGTWAELAIEEIRARRAAYAARVASNIAGNASDLLDRWTTGFVDELRLAGSGSNTYRTTQAGLDALFASMFYIDTMVKDRKLATPIGLSPSCTQDVCPDLLEAPFAAQSLAAVQVNLRAFDDIFRGGPASATNRFGFGDLLRAADAGQLATDMEAAIDLAITRSTEVSEPMSEVLGDQGPLALHDAVKSITDILKSQFVSVLALRVPNEGAADND